tara:strand:- start:104560 stop:104718 length:159 start_codon:yes stop_codon:yes gene_type:complete
MGHGGQTQEKQWHDIIHRRLNRLITVACQIPCRNGLETAEPEIVEQMLEEIR